ncbi:MAG: pentapeptide repeat-containing protein [Marinobacter sp.]|uniref:pentapeptide repeat-containing protein n=1 Tax=Marinobacter sp. TaxID=50741 RepID=UPI003F9D24E7
MKIFKDGEQHLEASFKKHEVPEECYEGVEFEECQFLDCDFSGVKFQNCNFVNCEFVRCNLSLVNLFNTRLFGINFRECKLIGIDWTQATWPIYHVDFELRFEHCILNDSSFFGLTLNELTLDECKLHDVDFREGNFNKSAMNYSDFTHSVFMRTSLQSVDFCDSTNYAINVLENNVECAKFSRFEALNLLECLGIELVD